MATTPAAKLASTSISLAPKVTKPKVGGIILAYYLSKHPTMQSPVSYSPHKQLESHFSAGALSHPAQSQNPTVSLLRLEMLETLTKKKKSVKHTRVGVYLSGRSKSPFLWQSR